MICSKNLLLFTLPLLGLLSCSSQRALPRRALAPATATTSAATGQPRLLAEAAERQGLTSRVSEPVTTPEPSAARPAPVYRTFVERVEVPVERVVEAPRERDVYSEYVERAPAGQRRQPSPFPINTAVGAGVGAVIGHQSGRRDEGALWGAGIGLLFDMARWTRW